MRCQHFSIYEWNNCRKRWSTPVHCTKIDYSMLLHSRSLVSFVKTKRLISISSASTVGGEGGMKPSFDLRVSTSSGDHWWPTVRNLSITLIVSTTTTTTTWLTRLGSSTDATRRTIHSFYLGINIVGLPLLKMIDIGLHKDCILHCICRKVR